MEPAPVEQTSVLDLALDPLRGGSRMAGLFVSTPALWNAESAPRWLASHDALFSTAPSLADPSSSESLEGIPGWSRCPCLPSPLDLVNRPRRFCLRRIPRRRGLDLGEHFVVAIQSSTVSPSPMAHPWCEHWSPRGLTAVLQPNRLIMRCTIPHRWGNLLNEHHRNRI